MDDIDNCCEEVNLFDAELRDSLGISEDTASNAADRDHEPVPSYMAGSGCFGGTTLVKVSLFSLTLLLDGLGDTTSFATGLSVGITNRGGIKDLGC